MKHKILSLLTLLTVCVTGAWADSTASWSSITSSTSTTSGEITISGGSMASGYYNFSSSSGGTLTFTATSGYVITGATITYTGTGNDRTGGGDGLTVSTGYSYSLSSTTGTISLTQSGTPTQTVTLTYTNKARLSAISVTYTTSGSGSEGGSEGGSGGGESSGAYTITKGSATNGSITVASSADENDVVDITATPNTGYAFNSWNIYKTGEAATTISPTASSSTTTFTMPSYNVTVDATFTVIDYTITHDDASNGSYTIKVAGGDAVGTSTTANYGQTITLSAMPDDGYELSGWSVVDASSNTVTVTKNQFTMPASNVTISATFSLPPIVTLPTSSRTGYSVSVASSNYSRKDHPFDGVATYTISNGGSITLTVPSTTNVTKIKVSGSSDDSSTSTVTIEGANDEKSTATTFVNRDAGTLSTVEFVPTTQTTTYTIKSANKKSVVQISIYGEEFVLTPKKTYTTLTSAYNLDFTNVAGLSAYIVKADGVSENTVTLTQVNKVPAGTGLVLKGTANAKYPLTTYEGDGDDVSGNKMLGSATAETTPATGAAYILSDGEFHPWNGEGKIAAGKAYLNVSSGSAKALSINFADTTGISNAEDSETSMRDNDKMYNLGGQLVGEGYKGIVIVNGKKVIK